MASRGSTPWRIRWGSADERIVRTLEELQESLDSLQREYSLAQEPVLAEIEAPTGDSLAIGLGRDWSMLNFVPASHEPPYFTSVGGEFTEELSSGQVFRFGDEWTEIPCRNLIPLSSARDAASTFFETNSRPPLVEWEED